MRLSGVVKKLFLAVVLLGVMLATAGNAGATGTLYVKQGGTGDCSSWTNACDLQTALGKAGSGDQVWVEAGTYKPSTQGLTDPRTATFTMRDGVAIYGGFAGDETDLGQRNWSSNVTILSGDIGTAGDASDNAYNVVTVPYTVSSSGVLDGFTISGGNANGGTSDQDRGGGIQVLGGSPTLANLTVTDNQASFCGGGVQSNGGAPTLTNVRIVGNTATNYGGGMYSLGSSGGGTVVLRNVIFSGNSAAETWGGGLYAGQGTMALTNVAFSGNSANDAGGMAWDTSGSVTLTNVTFSGNQDAGWSPALLVYDGTATMVNSIVWDNTAPSSVPQVGTGTATNGNGTINISYSDVQGGCTSGAGITCGSVNVNSNPLFVTAVPASPMPNTGGDLRLSAGSPAINLGDNSVVSASTDLAGATRIVGGTVDLGAYEYQGNSAPAVALQPSNQSVAPGSTATFTALAGGNPTPTVQWQVLTTASGASWSGVSGATSTTLALSDVTASMNGYQYRAVFTNSAGSATSNAAILTVDQSPAITSASTTTFTVGTAGSFTVSATGYPTPTLNESGTLPGGVTFTDNGNGTATIAGTTGAAGSFPITITAHNGVGSDATQAFTLTVDQAPKITSANSTTFTVGTAGSFTVTATGYPTPMISESGTLPTGVSFDAATGVLSGTPGAGTGGTYILTFKAANGISPDATQTFTVTVQFAPIVTTQPTDQSVPARSTATFTAAANGSPTPSVQWQASADNGASWSNIRGATSPTYSFTARATDNGSRYRAIFTNSAGSTTSDAAILTITTGGSGPSVDVGITQKNPGTYDSSTKTITWTLTVTNSSANTAQGVEVTDTLAKGTKLSSVTTDGTAPSYVKHGSKVIVTLGDLAAGSSKTITIKAVVTRASGTVDNTATVTTTGNNTDTLNNTSTASVTVP